MKKRSSAARKTLAWASIAYGAFTAISIVGPIILERIWNRSRSEH